MKLGQKRWAALWYSKNISYGVTEYFITGNGVPLLFRTRKETNEYIKKNYGYIKTRKDLRSEPHGWRVPRAVRVRVEINT